ncbi:MAG: heme ABC exporter ATP-binding protein CcmA [Actinomycetota bacterium]
MIHIEQLTISFGRTVALDALDLAIRPGVTGVFGPNGSGKSTLLRAVAGLLRPTRGRVAFNERTITAADERFRRLVGYAGHDSGLYGRLSLRENLTLFARLHGAPGRRSDEVIAQLGLDEHAGKLVGDLSAGLKRRAAVARALLHEPDLLLLDEPYANLDDDAAALVSAAIQGWGAPGRTALIATHGAKNLKRWVDAGIILQRGRVSTYGRYGVQHRFRSEVTDH